jgi:hypothetical protein
VAGRGIRLSRFRNSVPDFASAPFGADAPSSLTL